MNFGVNRGIILHKTNNIETDIQPVKTISVMMLYIILHVLSSNQKLTIVIEYYEFSYKKKTNLIVNKYI